MGPIPFYVQCKIQSGVCLGGFHALVPGYIHLTHDPRGGCLSIELDV